MARWLTPQIAEALATPPTLVIDSLRALMAWPSGHKYELSVHIKSELKVHASSCDIEPMVHIEDLRAAFVARLKKALEAKEIPQWGAGARLAKMANVTPKAASKWMNGESIPGAAKMLALANALDVKVEWLQHGSGPGPGESAKENQQPSSAAQTIPSPQSLMPCDFTDDLEGQYTFIDQYDARAAAGTGFDNVHVVLRNTLAFKTEWLRAKGVKAKNLKVIYAHGDSMWPTINHHDVLLVDESRIEPSDGQIFVMGNLEGSIVKRLVRTEDGGWIICSDNPDKSKYPNRELSDEEINEHRILGRVIWRGGDL